MSEKPPVFEAVEQGPERIPEEAEIRELFEKFVAGKEYTEFRRLEDEKGMCVLEIKITEENGDITEYAYARAGQHADVKAAATAIHVMFCDSEGMPAGGHLVATFDGREWIEPVETDAKE